MYAEDGYISPSALSKQNSIQDGNGPIDQKKMGSDPNRLIQDQPIIGTGYIAQNNTADNFFIQSYCD